VQVLWVARKSKSPKEGEEKKSECNQTQNLPLNPPFVFLFCSKLIFKKKPSKTNEVERGK
jgi:hypothetical protein